MSPPVQEHIAQLQTQEKQIHVQLDDPQLTPAQKQMLIQRINEITQIRINLYALLQNTYETRQSNLQTSTDALEQSMKAIQVLEDELNQHKSELNALQNKTNDELRVVEINTYYGKQYSAHIKVIQKLIGLCVIWLVVAGIAKMGMLPSWIHNWIAVGLLVVAVFIIVAAVIDMSNRDNMNWDEYNWYFNKSTAPSPSPSTVATPEPVWNTEKEDVQSVCVGSACCYQGSSFDAVKNVCVVNEAFQGLEKHAYQTLKL